MEKEIAFIPAPGAGHLVPMVEFATAITRRDHRISVTVFISDLPFQSKLDLYTQTLLSDHPLPRLQFIHLSVDEPTSELLRSKPNGFWLFDLIEINKSRVKDFYSSKSTHHRLVAFVTDMLCTAFADVASEFGVPNYVFFTSSACFLSLSFYLQSLQDYKNQDIYEFKDSDTELLIPGFMNPVPTKVFPYVAFDKGSGWNTIFFDVPRKLRTTKGILVNTFLELESFTLEYLSRDETVPPIFPVGPMINVKVETSNNQNRAIMTWLDNQPLESVVFLCLGSMGTFETNQVVEIAHALEQSGHRFLWSLLRAPENNKMEAPSEFVNFDDVLPEGFLERTKNIGKVIGWAPQVAVLSCPAVGGFITHCGWNSTLESLWCGVPVATWPLSAEQQLSAFELVKELGLAVEIKLDYRKESPVTLSRKEIEGGIKRLMEGGESIEIRNKVKKMNRKSRMAVMEEGSSFVAMGRFIEEVLGSSP